MILRMDFLLKLLSKVPLSSEDRTKTDKKMENSKCFKRERIHQKSRIGLMEENNTTNEIIQNSFFFFLITTFVILLI